MQMVRFRRIDNKWSLAMKVMRGGEILKEIVDENFPRNEEGKIDW